MTDVREAAPTGGMTLDDKYVLDDGGIYLTGVQALARLPMDQIRADRRGGLRTAGFISGYPGSPLGGYDQELLARAAMLDALGIVHRPAVNEELAATAMFGTQSLGRFGGTDLDGVFGIWYGKSPGVERATDAIRHGNFAGTSRHGGVLLLAGDDPSCKSSSVPNSSTRVLAGLNVPVLHPGTIQEVLDLGRHGIALSRASGLWTGLKITTSIADGAGTAEVAPDRIVPRLPLAADGTRLVGRDDATTLSPLTILQTEREIHEVRLLAAQRYAAENGLNAITHDAPGAWLGIVAPGHTYYDVVEALHQLGLDDAGLRRVGVRLLRIGMVHPLEHGIVRRFADGLDEILVVEEKQAHLEVLVRDVLYGTTGAPVVVGKLDEHHEVLVRSFGALEADAIREPLRRRLLQRVDASALRPPARSTERIRLPLVPRTPYFCSGCPHNTSLKSPAGSYVGAGIGCHSMVSFLDAERAGNITGVTQMGGEGTQWIGAAPFVQPNHIFQNLGDGTFFHSGSLAVRAAVAAGVNITFKLLYNDAVAMTGGQDAAGQKSVPEVVDLLLAEGVARIIVTTEDRRRYRDVRLPRSVEVWDRSRIVEVQERLRDVPGTTVLIHDQRCAAESRRLRKRGLLPDPPMRVVIDQRVCEGCGDCGVASNCLSLQPLETEFGDKTAVDQASCNKDYSCLDGDCPSFLTITPRRRARAGKARTDRGRLEVPVSDLPPTPAPVVPVDDFTIRMPGIGGTGVVTVAQILGAAATIDGRHVAGMDQTGLSQKGGGVVSDLRIATAPIQGGNKLAAGDVDLYLAFDIIGALNPPNIDATTPDRTVAVVSTTRTATGLMIGRPGMRQPPLPAMREVIDATTRRERNVYLDAGTITTTLFGRATPANLFLLGAAYQAGAIPLAHEAIEEAIELNGVAVEMNRAAFRWGRIAVHDPARLEAVLASSTRAPAPDEATVALIGDLDRDTELGRLLRVRVPDLIDYQHLGLAEQYLALVRRAADAEAAAVPGSTAFAESVARWYYKLLAYKDEYEVARLHLQSGADAVIDSAADGRSVKVSWNLHPPVLRSMGLHRKLRLGPWFRPALIGLRALRRLRGTPFDVFGYAHVRRVERRLADDYARMIERVAGGLEARKLQTAIALAALPDMVRGYEHIKLANVERYEAAARDLLRTFEEDHHHIEEDRHGDTG